MTGHLEQPRHSSLVSHIKKCSGEHSSESSPAPQYTMPNNTLDRAIEAVPKFGDRISLFTQKLRLAQYADSSIYNYRLKIAQAVLYLRKLPDNFTQADVDDYLSMLLDRNCYSLSFFKHSTKFSGYYMKTDIFPHNNYSATEVQHLASYRASRETKPMSLSIGEYLL